MNNPGIRQYHSPLGTILLAAQNGALTEARFINAPENGENAADPVLTAAAEWLDRYFAGTDPGPVPPCAPKGTAFQKTVWEALRSVPCGETVSYETLAMRCGLDARYARAVGAAVGKNPIVLFLPCHRVLGKSGALCGYAYGPERKAALLSLEGVSSYVQKNNIE